MADDKTTLSKAAMDKILSDPGVQDVLKDVAAITKSAQAGAAMSDDGMKKIMKESAAANVEMTQALLAVPGIDDQLKTKIKQQDPALLEAFHSASMNVTMKAISASPDMTADDKLRLQKLDTLAAYNEKHAGSNAGANPPDVRVQQQDKVIGR
jgi:hypothetical protein